MHLVKLKIKKDRNTIQYIKLLRGFDSSLSLSGIKNGIEAGETVLTFDLDNREWIYEEDMTENKYHRRFWQFLQQLQRAGAALSLTYEYEVFGKWKIKAISMKELDRIIRFNKEIADEVENNPD